MKKAPKHTAGSRPQPRVIYLVAEGTGETISKIAKAALAQFDQQEVQIQKYFQVTTKQQISVIIKKAVKDNGLLAFSIVAPTLADFLLGETTRHGIKAIDVIGDFIVQLSMFLAQKPKETPGGQHILDKEYYRRIEAVNYAVKHDDGKTPQGLKAADIILVGLSRTGKTPLSTYLAHQGWKVANIPLHPDMDAPEELFKVDPSKVFGLTIDVENLVRVREARLEQLGLTEDARYADPVKISDEIEWCDAFFKKHRHWRVVEISNKAIEEVAVKIVNLYEKESGEMRREGLGARSKK